jgi:hypothetical protein
VAFPELFTKDLMGISPANMDHQWNETDPEPTIQLDLDFNGIPSGKLT